MEKQSFYLICEDAWAYDLATLIREIYPLAETMPMHKAGLPGFYVDGACALYFDEVGKLSRALFSENEPTDRLAARATLLRLLEALSDKKLPWGILTGVRPTKIAYAYLEEGKSLPEVEEALRGKYCLRADKALLCAEVAKAERALLSDHDPYDISVYVGVPFCPTRCAYCSFVSNDGRAYKKHGDAYVEALIREIRESAGMIAGRRLQSFYMGGGTPTTLSAEELDRILTELEQSFGDGALLNEIFSEVTVEAGRPDTFTRERLEVLKKHGVERISINPQSMNQKTLERIGRAHRAENIYTAFELAREKGFSCINMDFIIGLPGEGAEEVRASMDAVKALKPENLTIHTLAIKRSSRLNETESYESLELSAEAVEELLGITSGTAAELGLKPYYMYRQKNMAGNFENVGYAIPGKECLYNIEIMEERQTILGLGAGAVTKLYYPAENRLERVPNMKTAETYIERLDEQLAKKREGFS